MEDYGPGSVFTKQFLGDVALGEVALDLPQRELFQLGDAVLTTRSVPVR